MGVCFDAPIVSDDRTAKPSMAELLKRGDENFAIISSWRMRPLDFSNGTTSDSKWKIFS